MNKRIYYLVNGITLYRMMAAPPLLLLVVYQQLALFKWLLAFSFFTDAIDGYLARRFKVASIAGARFDSIADDLTIMVSAIGMIVFKPGFLKQEIFLIIFLFSLFVLQTVLALIRYRRMTGFHTYSAKAAAILQGIFLILLFFLPRPIYGLFYVAVFFTAIELIEEIIIIFLLPDWKTDVKGLYWVIKHRKEK